MVKRVGQLLASQTWASSFGGRGLTCGMRMEHGEYLAICLNCTVILGYAFVFLYSLLIRQQMSRKFGG